LAVELGYDARRPVDHPTPFEPTECCNLTRKGSRLPRHLVVLFSQIGRWRERTKKSPAEAGPEVAEPQQAASVA
jgi:hypothetical protein